VLQVRWKRHLPNESSEHKLAEDACAYRLFQFMNNTQYEQASVRWGNAAIELLVRLRLVSRRFPRQRPVTYSLRPLAARNLNDRSGLLTLPDLRLAASRGTPATQEAIFLAVSAPTTTFPKAARHVA
jgi:hypothetical protein